LSAKNDDVSIFMARTQDQSTKLETFFGGGFSTYTDAL